MNPDSINEFIREEVPDWDDELTTTARFKAFSGQRSDWDSKYQFWKHLIVKIARHFSLIIVQSSQIKKDWFNRGGLTPLCIDHVLFLMYNEGIIIRKEDLTDPTSGRLSWFFKKVRSLMARPSPEAMLEDAVIFRPVLEDKASEIVKQLSESNWTSSCIVTMRRFQGICGDPDQALVMLSHLSGCGRACYMFIKKKEFIEGVKVSLSSAAVSSITTLDGDVLHLIWTAEKLEQQLDVIDQRYEKSRTVAIASLRSGNRKVALRHARELKLVSESREKCSSLLSRVEEVLQVIVDAESTKKVSEAIQIGAHAIMKNKLSVEEVELCLEDIRESIDSQKLVEEALETTSFTGVGDEYVEDEFRKLELEVGEQVSQPSDSTEINEQERLASDSTLSLSDALSNMKLADGISEEDIHDSGKSLREKHQDSKSTMEAV